MKTFLIAIWTLVAPAAFAQTDFGSIDYLYGWQNTDGSYQTAIAIDLNPGWKTYWRVPGPAGIPPEFDWSASENILELRWSWPTPHVFHTNDMMSIGYSGTVIVPVTIVPENPSLPVNIDVQVSFGVCADICIPADARLAQRLSPTEPSERAVEIRAALADVPLTPQQAGIQNVTCQLAPSRKGFEITANMTFARDLTGSQQLVIEYRDPDIWIAAADTDWSGRELTGITELQYFGGGMLSVDRSRLRLTVIQDTRAIELFGCPSG